MSITSLATWAPELYPLLSRDGWSLRFSLARLVELHEGSAVRAELCLPNRPAVQQFENETGCFYTAAAASRRMESAAHGSRWQSQCCWITLKRTTAWVWKLGSYWDASPWTVQTGVGLETRQPAPTSESRPAEFSQPHSILAVKRVMSIFCHNYLAEC